MRMIISVALVRDLNEGVFFVYVGGRYPLPNYTYCIQYKPKI